MKKKVLVVATVGVLMLAGCSVGVSTKNVAQADLNALQSAITTLKAHDDYIISSSLDTTEGSVYSIETVHGDTQYVEYPIDENGNVGTMDFGSQPNMTYALSEWYDPDGSVYSFASESVLKMPQNYNKWVDGRSSMFLEDMLPAIKSCKQGDTISLNIMGSDVSLKTYDLKVDSSVMRDILGVTSYAPYKAVSESSTEPAIKKYAGWMAEGYAFDLTCSDANVTVCVDIDNNLRAVMIEVGGAGYRVYLTKVVISFENFKVRETPDFTNTIAFEETFRSTAEVTQDCNTYEEAAKLLEQMSSEINGVISEINGGTEDSSQAVTSETSQDDDPKESIPPETVEPVSEDETSSTELSKSDEVDDD